MKKNTYYVPVETKSTSILVIEAETQAEAVKQVEDIITKKRESLADRYDSVKVISENIECKEDEEMLRQMAEDLNAELSVSEYSNGTLVKHSTVTIGNIDA